MFIILFIFWLVLNGAITTEIVIIGLVLVSAVYAFMCRFFDFSIKKDLKIARMLGLILQYVGVLIVEIIKAAVTVVKVIINEEIKLDQTLITFETDLQSDVAKAVLADSITLTPGTITVIIKDNHLTVHCLSREMLDGIQECKFVQLLRKMEANWNRD